ncbi:hypothetical protein G7050_11885 [Dysgonomonas sp. HDW5A]|uniref:hypothetical protein n=1 Tax=Dysgonomonas sp. HDW5A TaxID=2714926 RepID=UPI0014080A18|nr:hypothetical protein [Dysgonomonas sp. HDW5A]QIK60489.1 hypothetical protein G7050_11885 [Dysgonomonas sp. HDW5A]
MKTDLYTKTVLTIIAIFLGVLIFQNTSVISTVQANTAATSPATLPTATQAAPVDVNISHLGGVPITNYLPGSPEYGPYRKEFNLYYNDGLPVTIRENKDK